ncbi:MAG TPA: ABC transporter ATP-binding protein [Methylomirabilota bacterium]|nr:ABC transporter ATP-binding protein [Methylomirabilota bacterium]
MALLELADVAFTYSSSANRTRTRFGLSGINCSVEEGEILGVIGPNSAGKTTLIRLLSKVLAPTSGVILLGGRRLSEMSRWEVAREIAVVPQDLPSGLPFTVAELVLMGRYPHRPGRYFEDERDRRTAEQAMRVTGVLDLAGQPFERLAGGERQRAVLARALAQEPRVLLLDEPTAHLDLRYQAETAGLLRRLNRERGVTILLVSHDLNLAAELSNRLLLLADGRIQMIGPPEHVINEELLEAVYGCPVHVGKNPESGRPNVQLLWPQWDKEVTEL